MTMQIAGAEDVVLQSDAEPAAKQVVHAVQACRVRLGLRTEPRFVPRASHASNGVAGQAVSTVRRLALTLKAHLEDRAKIKLTGQMPLFSWIMQHASFLHNRFFTTTKGLPPFEVINGRRYRGQLVQFGECCVGFCPTKYKGDFQWRKGVWAGINEKNGSHILLSETVLLRHVPFAGFLKPEESQCVAEEIVSAKWLPWDYGGSLRRKRALYTSRAGMGEQQQQQQRRRDRAKERESKQHQQNPQETHMETNKQQRQQRPGQAREQPEQQQNPQETQMETSKQQQAETWVVLVVLPRSIVVQCQWK
ncbi:unnamed protein product [Symbiodinium sp. CCMP2456]|nr:unnamed protein product [Symbiodinium sp. CCMP2456]